ncbi:hypothetical protein A2524_04540 [Candidatus Wolfebacteria bacterium RIFOXYD12_FULL_48_21]|uniref:Uncharacterized protein n=1 Tax=Candidatus Wolfebacteria bacterium RIFOXYD1_FULL_48_65 TaxID=1802561 RepID=A0A1F8E6Q0_9BACT|nr:MAG: hypothetical protein A2524_04540 [Candidatus Wolfebacteria bacterium RIFOXYD12_FULL_48_21]OGM95645.1 MAG: hypothetical protein A2610_02385 [Candidatus Wolfebacteria bacterium RIFOXYD1_FULL_48_65]OGM96747.1 MAG: hypothetical protein A2532_04145 [Candidatus Wolfebacteria bacterium RIFOXYD2_FULL_48_11]
MEAKIVGSFRINTAGNRTTEEVVAAGNYDWTNDRVNGENFPMRPMPEGPRKIVYLEFEVNPYLEEKVLVEAQRQGLERPLYEDVLFFGEQYPEEQRKGPIAFLHEPWHGWRVGLGRDKAGRGLGLNYFGGIYRRRCRFAFILP